LLKAALGRSEELMEADPANLGFVVCHIKVLRFSALGLVARARQESTARAQRPEFIHQAEAHLDHAEMLFARLPNAAGPSLLRTDLERARAELVGAKAQLKTEANGPATP
jgi:hypothetical protein